MPIFSQTMKYSLDELEKREGAGTMFVQSVIAQCSSTSCWPEKKHFSKTFNKSKFTRKERMSGRKENKKKKGQGVSFSLLKKGHDGGVRT